MPFSRLLPLSISARQAPGFMEPVGEALSQREESVLTALFEPASQKHTSTHEQKEQVLPKSIERLDIEVAGIMERLRLGTVEMEEPETQRKGDVYRELKVGVTFQAERGRERCELAKDGLG